MNSLKILAKLFQFLSSCIILIEIVGEDRFKLAVDRTAQRIAKRRRPNLWLRVRIVFRSWWTQAEQDAVIWDSGSQQSDVRPKREGMRIIISRIVWAVVIVGIIMLSILMKRKMLEGTENIELVGEVAFFILAMLTIVSMVALLFFVVITEVEGIILMLARMIDRLYSLVLRTIVRVLDRDRVKRRLLVISFLLLVIGTGLDIAQE